MRSRSKQFNKQMKKINILLAAILLSSTIFAQNSETKYETKDFKILFPNGKPQTAEYSDKNKYGTINMKDYMQEADGFTYALTESYYTKQETGNSPADTLLEKTMVVLLAQLDVSPIVFQRLVINGNPGVYMQAKKDGEIYLASANYLLDTKLYQITLYREDRMPTNQEIYDFIFSFELKNQPVYTYFEGDRHFKINFSGKKPKENFVIADKDKKYPYTITSYGIETAEIAYIVTNISYTTDYLETKKTSELLREMRNKFLSTFGFEITISRDYRIFGGYPGFFFRATDKKGIYSACAQYLIEGRYYQIAIVKANTAPTDKEVKEFIYSFELK